MSKSDLVKSEALTKDSDSPQFAKKLDVEFDGETYEVWSDAHLTADFFEAQEAEHIVATIKALVGEAQWRQFKLHQSRKNDGRSPLMVHPDGKSGPGVEFFKAILTVLDPKAASALSSDS